MTAVPPWLTVTHGDAPLIIAMPHSGSEIPPEIEEDLLSPWLGRKDADWWIDLLYQAALPGGASIVKTALSRTVIDVNRDPSGASLYPGQTTTGLCPTESFDGETLYRAGCEPHEAEIGARRTSFFAPYHAALKGEIARLREIHPRVVVYDAHSIRSVIPRLFDGVLPQFNIGSNRGSACDPALAQSVLSLCQNSGFTSVLDGRFVGGWTTRHYGAPENGIHAIQMELAMRGYLDEPAHCDETSWPPPFDAARAAALIAPLRDILQACLDFARIP